MKQKKKLPRKKTQKARVAIVMGSVSDEPVMKAAFELLKKHKIPTQYEIVSAHRTPEKMYDFARNAQDKGLEVIIAGAGGAAHLPGMIASLTTLPVIAVPVKLKSLDGLDSLLSIVQMPRGVPVATMAIDGAENAGHLALRILALQDPKLQEALRKEKESVRDKVLKMKLKKS